MKSPTDGLFVSLGKINSFAESKSATTVFIYCIFITISLGVLDYYTTPDYTFAIFYLIPVSIAAWFSGRTYGAIISLSCAVTSFIAAFLWPKTSVSSPYVMYWDAVTNLVFFTITSLILSKLNSIILRERNMARTDYLTGISNSRYFYELARLEMKKALRMNSYTSIIYIDLDNFKEVNDNLGHFEGDFVLKRAAETLRNAVREIDIVARFGGDEFVVMMPNTDFDETDIIIDRIKSVLDGALMSDKWKVTASIGAITCLGEECSLDSLITASDRLMYEAKLSGKNMIIHKNAKDFLTVFTRAYPITDK